MRSRHLTLPAALATVALLAILIHQPRISTHSRYTVGTLLNPATMLSENQAIPPAPPPSMAVGSSRVDGDGEMCYQGQRANLPACAFVEAASNVNSADVNCTIGSVVRRWHVTTQEHLFVHLRLLWPDDRPRVFIDLGSQAGHGIFRNTSDALLWLKYFNHSGSLVIGVDAFEDFALDLQHRFDDVSPFASLHGVTKRSLHAAVGARAGPLKMGGHAAFTNYLCSRTAWLDDYSRFDRHGASDHFCRIPRQRAGTSTSTLPLPSGKYSFSTDPDQRYEVPSRGIDTIWHEDAGGRHVDFLKLDVDSALSELEPGLLTLLAARAVSIVAMEIDKSIGERAARALERMSCLFWRHGYALFLKVPCAGLGSREKNKVPLWSQRASYMPLSGRYHARLPSGWGQNPQATCEMGGRTRWTDCGTQDLLAIDLRRPELAGLVALGNHDCATSFPADVTADWVMNPPRTEEAMAATLTREGVPSYPHGQLEGERERARRDLWGGPKASKTSRPQGGVFSKLLADGTWSCGPMAKPKETTAEQMSTAVGPLCP